MTGYLIPRLECDGYDVLGDNRGRDCAQHFSGDVNVETLPQLRREALDGAGWSYRRTTVSDPEGNTRSVMVDLCGPCTDRHNELKDGDDG